jgi:hypothetical protein
MKVLGSVRHCQAGLMRKSFDRAGALAQQVKQFEPGRTCDSLTNPGELFVDRLFKIRAHKLFNRIVEY